MNSTIDLKDRDTYPQAARQYYVLDTDSVEESGETTAERRFRAQDGGSSSDSESDRCAKPEKKQKRKKQAGAKPAAKKAHNFMLDIT